MTNIIDAYRLINLFAFLGASIGYLGLTYLQLYRKESWPPHHTLPLLGTSTSLAFIAGGLWFSGPVAAVIVRALIVFLLVGVVVVLLRPLYLLRNYF